ncbi:hypothetical protein [Bacillus dakarensis]|uniref:hypothetical protein n=1 Tax=Robertmurraya dakarensis TaxID=1926278 RepID=UPI000982254B|nr:hypothetical protein [Bacillus dakarensis]
MKRKLFAGIFSAAFILGAGTLTFAASNDGIFDFEEMKPYMEEMHPDLTEEEQKEMFEACHGEGGMMENFKGENTSNMMNRF